MSSLGRESAINGVDRRLGVDPVFDQGGHFLILRNGITSGQLVLEAELVPGRSSKILLIIVLFGVGHRVFGTIASLGKTAEVGILFLGATVVDTALAAE